MVQKAEIIIEKFVNGITAKWVDPTGEIEQDKRLAINGQEPVSLGEMVWRDVDDILANSTGKKVKVSIGYNLI